MESPLLVRIVLGSDPVPWLRTGNSPYECAVVKNLPEAMAVVRQQLPSLVILSSERTEDWNVLRQARAAFPTLPIILISKTGSEEALLEALRCGVWDFFKHPVDPRALVDSIRASLTGQERRSQPGAGQAAHRKRASVRGGAAGQEISRAVHFLRSNFWRNDISLDMVAQVVNMSLFHFSRTFKRLTGTNYSEYLTKLRIDQARALVANRNLSITEICLTIGYSDLTHFERVFKRHTGVSPSNYRHQLRAAMPDAAPVASAADSRTH